MEFHKISAYITIDVTSVIASSTKTLVTQRQRNAAPPKTGATPIPE